MAGASQPLPFIPGVEAAGLIDGRRVIINGLGVGTARDGLYCERAAVPYETLVDAPPAVDDAQAAAVSVVGITAQRVLDRAEVGSEDLVVVLGASGGVGSVAVQLAKARGAIVVGVTSAESKVAAIRDLGADDVLVVSDEPLSSILDRRWSRRADVVLDPLGGRFTALGVESLAPFGRHIVLGRSAETHSQFRSDEFYRKNAVIIGYGGLADTAEDKDAARQAVLERISDGSVRIPIAVELPLDQAARALELLKRHDVAGKIILHPPRS